MKQTAIPTDFVLVLDNSGSMYYDYRPVGHITSMPNYIAFSDNVLLPFFVEGYGASDISLNFAPYVGASYISVYTNSTVGATGQNKYFYDVFTTETGNHLATRYYKYDVASDADNQGYYKIFQKKVGDYYNLAIKLKSGDYKYLYGNSLQDDPNERITANNQIIYNGPNIYHIMSRQEALVDGVKSFLDLIEEENAKDHWAKDPATGQVKVKKHQVSVVSFSSGYQGGGDGSIEEWTGGVNGNTKVIKDFTEVTEADDIYNVILNKMSFRGPQTPTQRGVHLAKLLLEDLQTREGGKYVALSTSGMVNRNKVVVVFTDGEPYDSPNNFFQITNPTVKDGKVIKEVGVGKINGRI